MAMPASSYADNSPADTPLLPWSGTLALVVGLAGAAFRPLARRLALGLALLFALALGAHAQNTAVYKPAKVSVGSYGGPASLGVDINHDGVVDFTLGFADGAFQITPAGQNAVLCDGTNSDAWAWNLPAGATVGPQNSIAGGAWMSASSALITHQGIAIYGSGDGDLAYGGNFVWSNGFIGLRLTVGTNETHYGFLQLDCRGYDPGFGGLYLGCAWNTAPSQPITTSWLCPLLSFTPAFGKVLVSWPIWATNYVLQTASTLKSGGDWTSITHGVFTLPPELVPAGLWMNDLQLVCGNNYYLDGVTSVYGPTNLLMSIPGYSVIRPPINSPGFFRLVPK